MAKIFKIADGLENMGALSTGGQGSVYKGRRIGEIFVAVKLLPTPIHSESEEDKNYRNFTNEVEKLKKVNEESNPHVVKILNSGITESGSLPFIEMEFIDGPDLEELLKSPHDPIFLISEIIKIANQLANALCHCHKFGVKHGDVKSNNVKFNIHTGNYILIDFGLSILSDEQRRTSLRHAGAVEFMAPEQNEGIILFQSDVYSYGIILFQMIAGVVPFLLRNSGQSAHNTVMVSHMEMPVPDVLALRKGNLPKDWPEEKKEKEMQVPEWLLNLMKKCLEKNPDARYANGMELYKAILQQNTALASKSDLLAASIMQTENEHLQALALQGQEKLKLNEQQIAKLKAYVLKLEDELQTLKKVNEEAVAKLPATTSRGVTKPLLIFSLLLTFLGGFAAHWAFFYDKIKPNTISRHASVSNTQPNIKPVELRKNPKHLKKVIPNADTGEGTKAAVKPPATIIRKPAKTIDLEKSVPVGKDRGDSDVGKVFTLAGKEAYFHNSPDESTRRGAFINHWNYARLTALKDVNGFIYVVYKNDEGQVSKGWLNKKDLKIVHK